MPNSRLPKAWTLVAVVSAFIALALIVAALSIACIVIAAFFANGRH